MESTDILRYTRPLDVLFAEDSTTMRRATETMLKKYFDRVDGVKDGQEAFEHYQHFYNLNDRYYDIVITDLEMPRMDGRNLASMIIDLNPKQHIVVISSLNDFHRLIDLMNLGVRKFLAKPIEETQLHNILFNVSQEIFVRHIQEQEQKEIEQHNAILKMREHSYLKKLEQSHKELEEFISALNESGIVSKTDLYGTITYVNDRFCEISGYSREELVGKNHRIVNSGEMSPVFFSRLWNTITSNRSYRNVFKNRTKGGSIFYIETLIKPISDINGEITEFIAISHDITLIMQSIDKARKAEKAKDEFFINIGHEMRTPLNAILGMTPLLTRRAKDDLKMVGMLEAVHQSADNLHHLIETVLDIQKIHLNTFDLMAQEFEPALILNHYIKNCMQKANSKHQTIKPHIDPNLPHVLIGDSKRMVQVFKAVFDNAIKFTPSGGKIDIGATYDSKRSLLILQVRDTGIGIAEENIDKIFDTTQIDSSATRQYEGAGLGLALAKKIIDRMKGTIIVKSRVNEGSTFTLAFPFKIPD